jgi:hypothetical protein
LIPEPIRRRRDPARKVFLDRLRPGRCDPRRQPGAIHRLVQQNLGHLGLTVAQENNQIILAARKGIDAARTISNFGRPVSCAESRSPSRVTVSTRPSPRW